jgi:hypothetical protein
MIPLLRDEFLFFDIFVQQEKLFVNSLPPSATTSSRHGLIFCACCAPEHLDYARASEKNLVFFRPEYHPAGILSRFFDAVDALPALLHFE